MENKILKNKFAVQIETTRGEITIDCTAGKASVGYHYKPFHKDDPYMNGSITVRETGTTDSEEIISYLKRSWIDGTPETVEQIANAACLVKTLADNANVTETRVTLDGEESFGPHATLNESLASISRLFHRTNGDGIERVIGVLVNDKGDENHYSSVPVPGTHCPDDSCPGVIENNSDCSHCEQEYKEE